MYESLLQSGDKELYSYCLLLDLTKGFHTVDHTIFIKKRKDSFGIIGCHE